MKTVKQALIDEIGYPCNEGRIENKLLRRSLDADSPCDHDVITSDSFVGATADCLFALLADPNFSESGISISLPDRTMILKQANSLYRSIGEEEKNLDQPTVCIGPPPGTYVSP